MKRTLPLSHLLAGFMVLLFSSADLSAQSVISDSLKKRLTIPGLTLEEKVMTMGRLGRSIYESHIKEGVRICEEALSLSRSLKDTRYQAFILINLGYLYVQQNKLPLARKAIDSALWFAARTEDKVTKGLVSFRKGWLQYIDNETDKAVGSLLQALRYLENQHAFTYESLTYHYLASAYGEWRDVPNQEKYGRLSLQTALQSGDLEPMYNAWLLMGNLYLQKFRGDTLQRPYLDSAFYYNRLLLATAQNNSDRLINHSTPAAVALNTANLFWEFFPKTYKDSTEKYINISLGLARPIKHEEIIANCYGILSEYAIADGDYKGAEQLLLLGVGEIANDATSGNLVRSRMYKGLAAVAEKSGDMGRALAYFKEYMKFDRALFNAERLNAARKLEEQYELDKKEQQLVLLTERAAFSRKMNLFYLVLAAACLVAAFFLFRSYHFRLRSSLQQQKILAHEKEESQLQSQLKVAEAKQLELEKNEALLQVNLRTEEAARLQAEQQLMKERQERLQKELLAGTLQVEEKNEMLQTLRHQLSASPGGAPLEKQLDRIINENKRNDEDFEVMKADFADIHPGFFANLQQKANDTLTRLDLKYCSYILMGLSNKEIANRLGVEPKSIRMARYRIKQKLELTKAENLDQFIRGL